MITTASQRAADPRAGYRPKKTGVQIALSASWITYAVSARRTGTGRASRSRHTNHAATAMRA